MTSSPAGNGGQLPEVGPGVDVESDAAQQILVDQPFTEGDLPALRRTVAAHADQTTLPANRVRDLVLIVSELASNAVRHGGGQGRLRLSVTARAVVCRVTDGGCGLSDRHHLPRQPPEPTAAGGRGLWLVLTFADSLALTSAEGGGASATATLYLPPADPAPAHPGDPRAL